jgi:tRNA A37 threonylcarbamoyltransferase TsaD
MVKSGSEVPGNIVSSQLDLHARYGGVVPDIARGQRFVAIIPVISETTAFAPSLSAHAKRQPQIQSLSPAIRVVVGESLGI